MKNILKLFSIIGISLLLAGCDGVITDSKDTNKEMAGKCSYLDCIKNIGDTASVEDINCIIGVDGQLIDAKYNKYEWVFNDEISLYATYYSTDNPTVTVDYYDKDIMSNKVDLSDLDTLKKKVKEGMNYSEFKQHLGNVEGVLIEKSKYTKKYIWMDHDGGYVKGTFNTKNECTYFSGVTK